MSNPGSNDFLTRLAERQTWITPELEASLQAAIQSAVHRAGGDALRNALRGDWIHQPLHPMVKGVPVGSWTATIVLDALGSLSENAEFAAVMDRAADATLVLGLLGAMAATVTGLNAWAEIEEPAARRLGTVRAVVDVAATGFFVASGFHRARNERSIARVLAGIGYLAITLGTYLGGRNDRA